MSRYDKYDPKAGGFRAPLAAAFAYTNSAPDWNHADLSKLFAVALNNSGQLLKFGGSGGNTNFVGLMVLTRPKAAGDIVDIMTDGDIVDLLDAEILAANTLASGQKLYADPAGTGVSLGQLTTASGAGKFICGTTVELNATTGFARLVARVCLNPMAA